MGALKIKNYQKYLIISIVLISYVASAFLLARTRTVWPYSVITDEFPDKIDPVDAKNPTSINLVNQIYEGLYKYNLTAGGEMQPIPCIASSFGTWNENFTEFSVLLRDDVTFHDGSHLLASDIKWNFDRIYRFTNLESNFLSNIYNNEDGIPILNHTEIVDDYTIQFILNEPWTLWENILAFSSSYILKPNEYYADSYVSFEDTQDAIGTGPYIISKSENVNIIYFSAFKNYRFGVANISDIRIVSISDPEIASLAVLNHEGYYGENFLAEFITQAESDPVLTIERVKTTNVSFLQMNCEKIPVDVRKAISYSLNFSAFIQDIFNGENFELGTPIPAGMMYYNSLLKGIPCFNDTIAREFLLNSTNTEIIAALFAAGINSTSNDTEWKAVAESDDPIFEYNFTHYSSTELTKVKTFLEENLALIGIKIVDHIVCSEYEWDDWVSNPKNQSSMMLSLGQRNPLFKDPITMMEPLFKTNATHNQIFISDLELDDMFQNYYNISMSEREQLVNEIQEKIISELVPVVYLSQNSKLVGINHEYTKNVSEMLNLYGIMDFYSIKANLPYWEHQLKLTFPKIFFLSLIYVGGFGIFKLGQYYWKYRKSDRVS